MAYNIFGRHHIILNLTTSKDFREHFQKNIIKISEEELKETLNTFLIIYNILCCTPNKYKGGKSPAKIMIGREVRTTLLKPIK